MNGPRGQAPAGGAGLPVPDYAEFITREYLSGYVRGGGAAVRFVVAGDDDVAARWHRAVRDAAAAEGYLYVPVDAAEVRVHMIDQVYAAVARAADWGELARRQVCLAWDGLGLCPPDMGSLTVAQVAAHHRVDVREAARSIRRRLEAEVLADASLAREFRLAALRLCQAQLGTGEVTGEERDAVLAWLRVQPVMLRDLRSASLYARVGRHNARPLLASLAAWRARVTGSGVVLDVDLARLAVASRPSTVEREGVYYTRAAVLDAYEVLRQLVDSADTLRGVFAAITVPPALVTDDKRGLPAYSALHLRVVDEVRDRWRTNPYAALIRLETRLEAVS